MNTHFFDSLYKELEHDNFSFICQAKYKENDITSKILKLTEQNILKHKPFTQFKTRLKFLVSESFQNILQHGHKPEIIHRTNNFPEMFMARGIGSSFYIATTNLIDNSKIDFLRSKLNKLNSLSAEELDETYKNSLDKEDQKSNGGAGLGLSELARKSGHKLDFDFTQLNYYLSIFYLQLQLEGKKSEDHTNKIHIDIAKKLHNSLTTENLLLLFKGDFSQQSILPIMEMAEKNLKFSEGLKIQKKVVFVLTEVLQNMSKHAKTKEGVREGMIMLGTQDGKYLISAGNFIEHQDVTKLKDKIEMLNLLDDNQLASLYKSVIMDENPQAKGGAGLGLIDIARLANKGLKFDFNQIDENTSFFTLHLLI